MRFTLTTAAVLATLLTQPAVAEADMHAVAPDEVTKIEAHGVCRMVRNVGSAAIMVQPTSGTSATPRSCAGHLLQPCSRNLQGLRHKAVADLQVEVADRATLAVRHVLRPDSPAPSGRQPIRETTRTPIAATQNGTVSAISRVRNASAPRTIRPDSSRPSGIIPHASSR